MRSPQDLSHLPRRSARRGRVWIVVAVVILIVLFASLKTLATFFTDYLWFSSVNLSSVWRHLFAVKAELFFGFAAIFFVLLWVNLAVVDRLAPSELALGPEDELVRRYQQRVRPRAVLVRSLVSVVVALIAASGAIGQWRNYLLFTDGVYFTGPNRNDPQFHKNIGFFIFKLPFLSFIVQWAFVSLVVMAVIVVIAHYLNGGIRVPSGSPSVAPQVKVHLSVLLACMALVKAVGYILARYNLDLSQNGYVQGATYTDVHARLPALTLLFWISLLAAVILLINIRRRGWALPVLGVGLWAFVAIVVGAIYPAIVQAVKVTPAQNKLEQPYIARNISATRSAMGINKVTQSTFSATQSLTAAQVVANQSTLGDVQLWDPTQVAATYTKLQATRSYYSFNTLAIDRYAIKGSAGNPATTVPMVVGVRQVNDSDLPSQGWVNTHLQYTHGYGMILAPANASTSNQPSFAISQVPARSSPGAPRITQPRVYFGVSNPNGGDAAYVLANTRQPEIDYQASANQNPKTSTYNGSGGVQLNNFFVKTAFAIRFGDFNLFVSNLVTPQSRLMFVRDITQMAQKAAPFLSFDADPYPVLSGGQIYWVLDAYTTSDNYPYAQNANITSLPSNSGLNQNLNYVRNSVKVVVNAYSGQMKFYDVTALTKTTDPILQTWEKVFPSMFTPVSQMPASLRAHLRYPEDLLTVQSAMYGKYHIIQPLAFYNATNAWNVSPSAGAGSPDQALPADVLDQFAGRRHQPGGPELTHLRALQGSRTERAVVQPGGFLRPRVHGRPDPDDGQSHRGRIGPVGLRQADRVPDAGDRRTRSHRRRHLGDSGGLDPDQLPQPARFRRPAGHAPGRPRRQLHALLPALLCVVVAEPVPQARLLHRRLRRIPGDEQGRLRDHPDRCTPVSVPGVPAGPDRYRDHAPDGTHDYGEPDRPGLDQPGQHRSHPSPDRPEGRQLRRLRVRRGRPPKGDPTARPGLGGRHRLIPQDHDHPVKKDHDHDHGAERRRPPFDHGLTAWRPTGAVNARWPRCYPANPRRGVEQSGSSSGS